MALSSKKAVNGLAFSRPFFVMLSCCAISFKTFVKALNGNGGSEFEVFVDFISEVAMASVVECFI